MPIVPIQSSKTPEGLRELMKGLTKEILREKPFNIYEFSANYFESKLKEGVELKNETGYNDCGGYEASLQTRERNKIPVGLVFKIIPEKLTNLIKDFCKIVLKQKPENICQFGAQYFRELDEANRQTDAIQYTDIENYLKNPDYFKSYVKCSCGRTIGEVIIPRLNLMENREKTELPSTVPREGASGRNDFMEGNLMERQSYDNKKEKNMKEILKVANVNEKASPTNFENASSVSESSSSVLNYGTPENTEIYFKSVLVIQRFFKRVLINKKHSKILFAKSDRANSQPMMTLDTAAMIIQRALRKICKKKLIANTMSSARSEEQNDNNSETASYSSAATVPMPLETSDVDKRVHDSQSTIKIDNRHNGSADGTTVTLGLVGRQSEIIETNADDAVAQCVPKLDIEDRTEVLKRTDSKLERQEQKQSDLKESAKMLNSVEEAHVECIAASETIDGEVENLCKNDETKQEADVNILQSKQDSVPPALTATDDIVLDQYSVESCKKLEDIKQNKDEIETQKETTPIVENHETLKFVNKSDGEVVTNQLQELDVNRHRREQENDETESQVNNQQQFSRINEINEKSEKSEEFTNTIDDQCLKVCKTSSENQHQFFPDEQSHQEDIKDSQNVKNSEESKDIKVCETHNEDCSRKEEEQNNFKDSTNQNQPLPVNEESLTDITISGGKEKRESTEEEIGKLMISKRIGDEANEDTSNESNNKTETKTEINKSDNISRNDLKDIDQSKETGSISEIPGSEGQREPDIVSVLSTNKEKEVKAAEDIEIYLGNTKSEERKINDKISQDMSDEGVTDNSHKDPMDHKLVEIKCEDIGEMIWDGNHEGEHAKQIIPSGAIEVKNLIDDEGFANISISSHYPSLKKMHSREDGGDSKDTKVESEKNLVSGGHTSIDNNQTSNNEKEDDKRSGNIDSQNDGMAEVIGTSSIITSSDEEDKKQKESHGYQFDQQRLPTTINTLANISEQKQTTSLEGGENDNTKSQDYIHSKETLTSEKQNVETEGNRNQMERTATYLYGVRKPSRQNLTVEKITSELQNPNIDSPSKDHETSTLKRPSNHKNKPLGQEKNECKDLTMNEPDSIAVPINKISESSSDNESDVTTSWSCSKESDENVYSDEFNNENINDGTTRCETLTSNITSGGKPKQGGIYEMDPKSNINLTESKLSSQKSNEDSPQKSMISPQQPKVSPEETKVSKNSSEESKNASPKSETLSEVSKLSVRESRVSPEESKVSSEESNSLTQELEASPQESKHLEQELGVTPQGSKFLPQESKASPQDSNNLPEQSNLPQEPTVSTLESEVLPHEQKISTENLKISPHEPMVSLEESKLPSQDSKILPADMTTSSQQSKGLSSDSKLPYQKSQTLLLESKSYPGEPKISFQETKTSPHELKTSLQETKISSQESEASPQQPTTLFEESRISSNESKLSLQNSNILPSDLDIPSQDSEDSTQDSKLLHQKSSNSLLESKTSPSESKFSAQEPEDLRQRSGISPRESNISSQDSKASIISAQEPRILPQISKDSLARKIIFDHSQNESEETPSEIIDEYINDVVKYSTGANIMETQDGEKPDPQTLEPDNNVCFDQSMDEIISNPTTSGNFDFVEEAINELREATVELENFLDTYPAAENPSSTGNVNNKENAIETNSDQFPEKHETSSKLCVDNSQEGDNSSTKNNKDFPEESFEKNKEIASDASKKTDLPKTESESNEGPTKDNAELHKVNWFVGEEPIESSLALSTVKSSNTTSKDIENDKAFSDISLTSAKKNNQGKAVSFADSESESNTSPEKLYTKSKTPYEKLRESSTSSDDDSSKKQTQEISKNDEIDSLEAKAAKLRNAEIIIEKMQKRRASETRTVSIDERPSKETSFEDIIIKTMPEMETDERISLTAKSVLQVDTIEDNSISNSENNSSALEENPERDGDKTMEQLSMENSSTTKNSSISVNTTDSISSRSVQIDDTLKYMKALETTKSDPDNKSLEEERVHYSLHKSDSVLTTKSDAMNSKRSSDELDSATSFRDITNASFAFSGIIKIQAIVRGFLARKRLKHTSGSSAMQEVEISSSKTEVLEGKYSSDSRKLEEGEATEFTQRNDSQTDQEVLKCTRRNTLRREDAMQKDSTTEEASMIDPLDATFSLKTINPRNREDTSIVSRNSESRASAPIRSKKAVAAIDLKWLALRQNSMPVQIESEILRVIPKHMRKRIRSAEGGKGKAVLKTIDWKK